MKKNKLLFLVTILVYLFLIGPLVVIMAASFSDTNYLKFPGEGFTLRWYQQVFTMSAFAKAARLSLFAGRHRDCAAVRPARGLRAESVRFQGQGYDQDGLPLPGADSVHRARLHHAALCGQSV